MTTATLIGPRRRAFPGTSDQVRQARRFVGQVLGGCPVAAEAVLLTSELVTNAILHTASGKGGKVTVTVYRAETRVRVEVMDNGSDSVPVVRSSDEAPESGYGLGLVDLMACRWGFRGGPRRRIVWFMLEWKEDPVTERNPGTGPGPDPIAAGPTVREVLECPANLAGLRERDPAWQIDCTPGEEYIARRQDGDYEIVVSVSGSELGRKISLTRTRKQTEELSRLEARFPWYWVQPVGAGYLVVPRGICVITAPTLGELESKLRRYG